MPFGYNHSPYFIYAIHVHFAKGVLKYVCHIARVRDSSVCAAENGMHTQGDLKAPEVLLKRLRFIMHTAHMLVKQMHTQPLRAHHVCCVCVWCSRESIDAAFGVGNEYALHSAQYSSHKQIFWNVLWAVADKGTERYSDVRAQAPIHAIDGATKIARYRHKQQRTT